MLQQTRLFCIPYNTIDQQQLPCLLSTLYLLPMWGLPYSITAAAAYDNQPLTSHWILLHSINCFKGRGNEEFAENGFKTILLRPFIIEIILNILFLKVLPDWTIFCKFLTTIFYLKSDPNIWWLLGCFEKHNFEIKTAVDIFGQLLENLVYYLLQELVTLFPNESATKREKVKTVLSWEGSKGNIKLLRRDPPKY